ncbi:MAG TPA: hypothetical protein VI524_00240 [Anaerolineales bacterium]|nr:hypothetical protein [Anaerolineales bacterium]
MKRILFLSVLLLIAACNPPNTSPTSSPEFAELLSTPAPYYPDTPSPARLDAPLIERPALIEVHFLNELDGWAVTETGIARTTDGGFTWYDVTPPEMTETGYSIEVFFLDKGHAWVQRPDFEEFPNSGLLSRTSDGGLTWSTSTTPFSDGEIHFLDPENGWMLADLGKGAGSNAVAVYQTIDGGSSWDLKYTNDPNHPEAGESLPLGGIKSGIIPLSMRRAWVGGVNYSPGTLYLYRTNDGGTSWSRVILELPAGAENSELGIDVDQMQFVSEEDGLLALHISGDSSRTALYVTHDAGNTWTLTPTLIPDGGASDFVSVEEAVIYNGEQFYVTRDAARTWSIIPPNIVFSDSFASMEFVNTHSGWVITADPTSNQRSLYRTHDGGATWFPVIP